MTATQASADVHRREHVRDLERHVRFLSEERERLERVLGLALCIATADAGCGPLDLLDVLELLDTETQCTEAA